jgi:uncharacterized protein (TIGR00251 family)
MMDLKGFLVNNRLRVLVKPNVTKTEILGYDEDRKSVRIAVKAVPDKGKANAALLKFVSKILGCKVMIVSCLRSRVKVLRVID